VRRLGYLLELLGHERQAKALQSLVKQAKATVLLDPSVKPILRSHEPQNPKTTKWMLVINEPVEIDF